MQLIQNPEAGLGTCNSGLALVEVGQDVYGAWVDDSLAVHVIAKMLNTEAVYELATVKGIGNPVRVFEF
jgi:hypothetical protein